MAPFGNNRLKLLMYPLLMMVFIPIRRFFLNCVMLSSFFVDVSWIKCLGGFFSLLKGHGAEQNMRSVSKAKVGSNSRKCGYRLTPGTVKYAAFHVLSVEGPSGLPITEIADRIEVFSVLAP